MKVFLLLFKRPPIVSVLEKAWGRFEVLVFINSKNEETIKYRAHALRFTIKCLPVQIFVSPWLLSSLTWVLSDYPDNFAKCRKSEETRENFKNSTRVRPELDLS